MTHTPTHTHAPPRAQTQTQMQMQTSSSCSYLVRWHHRPTDKVGYSKPLTIEDAEFLCNYSNRHYPDIEHTIATIHDAEIAQPEQN